MLTKKESGYLQQSIAGKVLGILNNENKEGNLTGVMSTGLFHYINRCVAEAMAPLVDMDTPDDDGDYSDFNIDDITIPENGKNGGQHATPKKAAKKTSRKRSRTPARPKRKKAR